MKCRGLAVKGAVFSYSVFSELRLVIGSRSSRDTEALLSFVCEVVNPRNARGTGWGGAAVSEMKTLN